MNSKDNQFVESLLENFNKWEWSDKAKEDFEKFCCSSDISVAPYGLPQGLVASGFLANIYLLDFDEYVSKNIGNVHDSFKIIDYCRYVDDIRLVISAPKHPNDDNRYQIIQKYIHSFFEKELKKLDLELNKGKTKVEVFRGRSVGISKSINDIQAHLSGPISLDDANDQLNNLESLLSLSNNVPTNTSSRSINRLASIDSQQFDVKEDTLKRFSANKICMVLRELRHFSVQNVDAAGNLLPGSWDYLQERIARKFIACWSVEPSLVLLLKKGLELFPSTTLLNPILDQLDIISNNNDVKQQAIATYCLSEIYRHSSTVIHKRDRLSLPAHANVDSFFERLQYHASQRLVKNTDQAVFDLLAKQAKFLLLVRLDTTLEKESNDYRYDLIFKLISGFRVIKLSNMNMGNEIEVSHCILLANQIVGSTQPLIRSVSNLLEVYCTGRSINELLSIVTKLSEQNSDFYKELVFYSRTLSCRWSYSEDLKNIHEALYLDSKPLKIPLFSIKGSHPLIRLITRFDNPFSNEIMALKLTKALLKKLQGASIEKYQIINLEKLKINFDGMYANPPTYEVFNKELIIDEDISYLDLEKEQQVPSFLNEYYGGEAKILQLIAICIRSCLLGKSDWTAFGQFKNLTLGYRGIKTSIYKRQVGLMTTPESICGEGAEISGWLTRLISKLLIWPGISINDAGYNWPREWNIATVSDLVDKRLALLEEHYCQLSGIPSLMEKVLLDWPETKKNLSVAMVQARLPLKQDFSQHGFLLDTPAYRAQHRTHVAAVSDLIVRHMKAQNIYNCDSKDKNTLDLIVWPELAVHQDDIDILKALSRKTRSMIFAGLTFLNQENIKGPNNCAVWIVPSKYKTNQSEIIRLQGKGNMMAAEKGKIEPWRPYQLILELVHPQFPDKKGFMITGSICYDATDISMSADLSSKSNAYIVSALNQDVNTFDTMVDALHYHMYQHVVLVNSGEFGGSAAKAPYKEPHKRLIAHTHGNDQVSINTFEMNMFDFRRDGVGQSMQSGLEKKTSPAGIFRL